MAVTILASLVLRGVVVRTCGPVAGVCLGTSLAALPAPAADHPDNPDAYRKAMRRDAECRTRSSSSGFAGTSWQG